MNGAIVVERDDFRFKCMAVAGCEGIGEHAKIGGDDGTGLDEPGDAVCRGFMPSRYADTETG